VAELFAPPSPHRQGSDQYKKRLNSGGMVQCRVLRLNEEPRMQLGGLEELHAQLKLRP